MSVKGKRVVDFADGGRIIYEKFLTKKESEFYYTEAYKLVRSYRGHWGGKMYCNFPDQKRATAWMADLDRLKWAHFNWTKPFTDLLLKVQQATGFLGLNSMLVNYYEPNGSHVPFHEDGDYDSALLSLGAPRTLRFRRMPSFSTFSGDHQEDQEVEDFRMLNGYMITVDRRIQSHMQHSLLVEPTCHKPRISLVFRDQEN